MAKQQILLVDADSSSARLLEVSLRSAGFTVAAAASAEAALGKLEHGVPDLILTDTRLPGADGFVFVKKLRARPELAQVPVVFLTEEGALDEKLRGLELGVDDYLAKPIMVREVVTRVQLLLARKKQQRIAAEPHARTRFSGSLEDVAVIDLLQTIAVSAKSGVASVKRGDREAWLYFEQGQIIDAEVGDLSGEEAVYRIITWTTGQFELEFRDIERPRVIEVPHQTLLMEGLRRVDELGRLAEQLPPEHAVVDIDHEALASRLNEIPDELNGILRLIDGKRTLLDLIDESPFDDLSTLTVLSKFYFEGLLLSSNPEPVEWAPGSGPGAASRHDSRPPADHQINEPHVPTLVPPARSTSAAVPSTTPSRVDASHEARRLTPASSHPPVDPDAKVTPKGIVNVGDATPAPPKSLPSPFRAANDAPRRSPIPMPVGNSTRTNGAAGNAHSASHTNGVSESRTTHGLSAASREPPSSAERSSRPVSPSSPARSEAEASRRAAERHAHETPRVASSRPPERSPLEPTRPASAPEVTAVAASSGAVPGSAPGSNPESEQEFFEAGDEGTYAGGPRSSLPVPLFDAERDEASRLLPLGKTPSRHARARRSTLIVAGVLALAAIPLAVAAWRHFAAQREGSMTQETSNMAPEQPASNAVKQPGNSASTVAPTPIPVSPVSGAIPAAADAGAPSGPDGSTPAADAVEPSAPSQPIETAPVAPARPAASASRAPQPAASDAARTQPPARRTNAAATPTERPAQKPPSPLEMPFVPPFKTTPPSAEPRPGDKPPTAAYPLR